MVRVPVERCKAPTGSYPHGPSVQRVLSSSFVDLQFREDGLKPRYVHDVRLSEVRRWDVGT